MNAVECIEIRGERVVLRDPRPQQEDVEAYLRWVTVETAWAEWDAPWEGGLEPILPERLEELRKKLLKEFAEPLPSPRARLWIERIGGPPLGWVCHYRYDRGSGSTWIGINICESRFWGQGLGTEALGLWIDYLLSNLDLEQVRMGTWSGNVRMVRCAEKCGFVVAGRRPGAREVGGRRYDSLEFVLARDEWKRVRAKGNSATG